MKDIPVLASIERNWKDFLDHQRISHDSDHRSVVPIIFCVTLSLVRRRVDKKLSFPMCLMTIVGNQAMQARASFG